MDLSKNSIRSLFEGGRSIMSDRTNQHRWRPRFHCQDWPKLSIFSWMRLFFSLEKCYSFLGRGRRIPTGSFADRTNQVQRGLFLRRNKLSIDTCHSLPMAGRRIPSGSLADRTNHRSFTGGVEGDELALVALFGAAAVDGAAALHARLRRLRLGRPHQQPACGQNKKRNKKFLSSKK